MTMTLSVWQQMLHNDAITAIFKALVYIIVGYGLARFSSKALQRWYLRHPLLKYGLLMQKIVFYGIFILFIVSALRMLGFDLHVLLGATGILTVAAGFAAQTSASNFISGLFLLGEHTFQVGDWITINDISGEIIAVDLLSLKLRRIDNTLVRIPNEIVIKSPLVNLTGFAQRRFDCVLLLSPQVTRPQLEAILLPEFAKEPLCLKDPAPFCLVQEIASNGIKVQISVWANKSDFTAMKYRVLEIIQQVCLAKQISIADSTQNIRLLKDT